MTTALVLGGNSDIALSILRRMKPDSVVLAVRDPDALQSRLDREPLPTGTTVALERWDALDVDAHEPLMARAADTLRGIDVVLCAVGSLGHGAGLTATPQAAADIAAANYTGPAAALTAAAQHLLASGGGTIVVLSSVAGMRARKSNYLYGSAKAGIDAFTQGLADSLHGTNVRVILVRPGFVTSKMTTGLSPAPLATTPEKVADAVAAAVAKQRSATVHVPGALGPMFAVLRSLPRPLWRRIAGDR